MSFRGTTDFSYVNAAIFQNLIYIFGFKRNY